MNIATTNLVTGVTRTVGRSSKVNLKTSQRLISTQLFIQLKARKKVGELIELKLYQYTMVNLKAC